MFVQAGIIAVFGLIGLWYGAANFQLDPGFSQLGFNPIIATSVGFVSFEGWQLLFYDQEQFDDPDADAAPKRAVIVIGALTAAFTALGSLEAVVEFASLAFIVVFGAMCALALTIRDEVDVNPVLPLIGAVGSFAFFVMLTWYLYSQLRAVFWLVIVIAAIVFSIEAMYFKRQTLSEGVRTVEKRI